MHPGGVRSAMDLFDFEKSANLKHPNGHQIHHRRVEWIDSVKINPSMVMMRECNVCIPALVWR